MYSIGEKRKKIQYISGIRRYHKRSQKIFRIEFKPLFSGEVWYFINRNKITIGMQEYAHISTELTIITRSFFFFCLFSPAWCTGHLLKIIIQKSCRDKRTMQATWNYYYYCYCFYRLQQLGWYSAGRTTIIQ